MRERPFARLHLVGYLGLATAAGCVLISAPREALGAARGDALFRVDRLLAGCRSYGARISTCAGSFRVSVKDDRVGGRRRPVGISGKWVLERRSRLFQEEAVTTYSARAEYRSAANPHLVRYGGRTERDTISADGQSLAVIKYDGAHVVDQESRNGEAGAVRDALQLSVAARWLEIGGQLRLPTKEDDVYAEGADEVAGIRCVKLAARRTDGDLQRRWWIAPDHDFMVIRLDEFSKQRSLRMRMEVKGVARFAGGLWLPTSATWEAAIVDARGHVRKRIRLERFQASKLIVNQPIKRLKLGALPSPAPSAAVGGGGIGGCGFTSLVDFCAAEGVELDSDELQSLSETYRARPESSFRDISDYLQSILHLPMAGYSADLPEGTCASCQEPTRGGSSRESAGGQRVRLRGASAV